MTDASRRDAHPSFDLDHVRRRVRVLMLLDALDRAGLVPVDVPRFHAYAFLANVLAPLWEMPPMDGSILKQRGGPFYPEIQRELDYLIGHGPVTVSDVNHVEVTTGRWRLEGAFGLNHAMADPILQRADEFADEHRLAGFLRELAYALSSLEDHEILLAGAADATYSDPAITAGNVVDFGEWRKVNRSVDAAMRFDGLLPGGGTPTAAERIHLYARHLHRRISAGR